MAIRGRLAAMFHRRTPRTSVRYRDAGAGDLEVRHQASLAEPAGTILVRWRAGRVWLACLDMGQFTLGAVARSWRGTPKRGCARAGGGKGVRACAQQR
jgi:hypothetical protein